MENSDWVCPFCKGTGRISPDHKPPTKLDTLETIIEKSCTHCLGTGRNDLPQEVPFEEFEDIFDD
jgi:hypothetical protein